MSDSILIVGTGAMASLFAARLAAAGTRVTMLGAWTSGLNALSSHGDEIYLTKWDAVEPEHPGPNVEEEAE